MGLDPCQGSGMAVPCTPEDRAKNRVKDYMRTHSISHPSTPLYKQPLHYPLRKEGQWRNGTRGVLNMRQQVQEEEGRSREAENGR